MSVEKIYRMILNEFKNKNQDIDDRFCLVCKKNKIAKRIECSDCQTWFYVVCTGIKNEKEYPLKPCPISCMVVK